MRIYVFHPLFGLESIAFYSFIGNLLLLLTKFIAIKLRYIVSKRTLYIWAIVLSFVDL